MKKLLGLIALFMLSVVLVGCGNEDHPLVGRWVYPDGHIFQYNADGTGVVFDSDGEIRFNFEWELTGENQYILTHTESGNSLPRTFEIDGNNKVWSDGGTEGVVTRE